MANGDVDGSQLNIVCHADDNKTSHGRAKVVQGMLSKLEDRFNTMSSKHFGPECYF